MAAYGEEGGRGCGLWKDQRYLYIQTLAWNKVGCQKTHNCSTDSEYNYSSENNEDTPVACI